MIVAGFGFRAGAGIASLRGALAACGPDPQMLATAGGKADSAALRQLAAELGIAVFAAPPALLMAQETLSHSQASLAAYGTGSVAEAAALAGAGPGARLIARRQISPDRMATCAMAEGDGA